MQQFSTPSATPEPVPSRIPEARYAYYRRCQEFRRNGAQCKAPAEKGAQICHAHAAQQAMAFRRDLERRIVLAEAVAEMRRRGKPECEMADLLTDFKGIQVTLAVVARALIAGRIDCKIAGRLPVHLQTMSKVLWMLEKTKTSPQINTDNTDLKELMARDNQAANECEKTQERLPLINTDHTYPKKLRAARNLIANERERTRIGLVLPGVRAENAEWKLQAENIGLPTRGIGCDDQDTGTRILRLEVKVSPDQARAHGPPESKAA